MEAGQLEQDQLQLLIQAKMTTLRLHKELLVALHEELGSVVTILVIAHREYTWASPEPEGQPLPWLQLPSYKCFYLDSKFGGLETASGCFSPNSHLALI